MLQYINKKYLRKKQAANVQSEPSSISAQSKRKVTIVMECTTF